MKKLEDWLLRKDEIDDFLGKDNHMICNLCEGRVVKLELMDDGKFVCENCLYLIDFNINGELIGFD